MRASKEAPIPNIFSSNQKRTQMTDNLSPHLVNPKAKMFVLSPYEGFLSQKTWKTVFEVPKASKSAAIHKSQSFKTLRENPLKPDGKVVRSSSAMAGYGCTNQVNGGVRRIHSAYGFRTDFESPYSMKVEGAVSKQYIENKSEWQSVDPHVPRGSCNDYFNCFCFRTRRSVPSNLSSLCTAQSALAQSAANYNTGAISKQISRNTLNEDSQIRTAERATEAIKAANNMSLPFGSHNNGYHPQTHASTLASPTQHHEQEHRASETKSPDNKERRRRKKRQDGNSYNRRSSSNRSRSRDNTKDNALPTNFADALSENSPPLPPSLLRKLDIKEVNGLGKIRVVLRVSPLVRLLENESSVLSLDKKRRQVTLADPMAPAPKDSRFGVAAPKMFAFDQVYSQDDSQSDVVSGAVSDVLHAVLAGNDGCILCFGGALLGKSYTMVGLHGAQEQFGVMPSCVSWLYKSIGELKTKSGARFSVRVSALAVDATGANLKDLLSHYSEENTLSPGASTPGTTTSEGSVLSSLCELRAPTQESAAHFLDVALAGRSSLALSSVLQRQQQQQNSSGPVFPGSATLIYTLHVYQYCVDKNGKGGVIGGRSRLHLVDMGDMSARHGNSSMSLSSLTSVLLAIFNGQKYLPHRDNRLTGVLKEALQSLTCHTALVVHVSPAARHAQHSLTTLQLASRVHRTRRKKFRGIGSGGSSGSSGSRRSSGSENSAGSSSLDFSSSDQSCDTVIYIGGGGPGDSTDGEHPPLFMSHHIRQPRSLGLHRLRSYEHLRAQSASPTPYNRRPASASPTPTSRSVPNGKPILRKPCPPPRTVSNNTLMISNSNSPRITPMQAGFIRHQPGVSQIIYPNQVKPLSQQPFMSTFKPLSDQNLSSHNNNHKSLDDNLNLVNGNQLSHSGSSDRLHNYNAYQEPNNLVPTALSPNQNTAPVDDFRYQLSQQQFHQQKLFQQHSLKEQQRILEQQNMLKSQKPPKYIPNANHQKQVVRSSSNENVQSKLDSRSDEQWIDGPRIHKSKVSGVTANKNEQDETWVDGPQVSTLSNGTQASAATSGAQVGTYGFMDDHKKTMIEKWVEVQTAQVVQVIEKTVGGQVSKSNSKSEQLALVENGDRKNAVPVNHMTQFRTCDESTNESDVDTLSEDPSGSAIPISEQPSLIQELERKNLIPPGAAKLLEESNDEKEQLSLDHILISSADETKIVSDCSTKGRGSPETTSLVGELSIDEVCSQCEALAEECEELSSLLSCEEEECKRQIHIGLATVMEEPELESAVAADEDHMRTSLEETDCESKMDTLRSSKAGGDDGNDADEESSEIGVTKKKCLRKTCPSSNSAGKETKNKSTLSTKSKKMELDLPAYPVVSVDCGTQVCAEDISDCVKDPKRLSVPGGDHPLRVLSEENLTCASNFTDTGSQICETADESEDEINQSLSHFRINDYAEACSDPSLAKLTDDKNILELAKIHALYRTLAEQSSQVNNVDDARLQPSSLVEILSNSRDSLVDLKEPEGEYASITSDFELKKPSDVCSSCNKERFPSDGSSGNSNISTCNCDIKNNLQPYLSSTIYMIPKSHHSLLESSSLMKCSAELSNGDSDYRVPVTNISDDVISMPTSKSMDDSITGPDFIEDVDANVILCNPDHFNINLETLKELVKENVDEQEKNDDSDCLSTVSDDSEYMMRTSKFSKFLCVGVGKSKSKSSYKLSKQNFKSESKKNSKMKESKSKASVKSRDSSKSPDFDPKNLLKSPSRVNSLSMSKSSSGCSSKSGGWKSDSSRSTMWNKFGSSKTTPDYSTNSSFSYQAHPVECYDSGHESGLTQDSCTPQDISEPSWPVLASGEKKVKEPSQRLTIPTSKSGTGSSLGTNPSLGDSSGYGSMARDSECSSFSSSQDSELEEEKRIRTSIMRAPIKLENFTEEDIQRYEGRTRNLENLYSYPNQNNNKLPTGKETKKLFLK